MTNTTRLVAIATLFNIPLSVNFDKDQFTPCGHVGRFFASDVKSWILIFKGFVRLRQWLIHRFLQFLLQFRVLGNLLLCFLYLFQRMGVKFVRRGVT